MARQPGTREASAARWVLYHSLKAASRSGDMVALTTKIAGRLTRRSLSRCQVGPERLGAPRGDLAPQLERPVALPSELGAPGPETSRDEVERVLVREADGAVRLMRNARPEARRFPDANLGDGDLEGGLLQVARAARVHGGEGVLRRHAGRRRVAGEQGKLMLDGLEGREGAPELASLRHVLDRLGEKVLEAARHLGRARERAELPEPIRRRPGTRRHHGRPPPRQGVPRLEGEVDVFLDRGGSARDQRDHWP